MTHSPHPNGDVSTAGPSRGRLSHHKEIPVITVFTKPDCVQCDRTRAQLTKHSLTFTTRDVTTDAQALDYITRGLGYRQAPVVVIDDGAQHWSGYRPDKIAQLASLRSPSAATTAAAASTTHAQAER